MIYLNQLTESGILKKDLLKYLNKIRNLFKIQKRDLSVTLCTNAFIKKLNKKYRHKNKPTDVLSFAMQDKKMLGDIIVSVPLAKKNSKLYGTNLLEEIVFLVVHGIIHLLGFNHQIKRDAKKMQALEKSTMYKLFKKDFYV